MVEASGTDKENVGATGNTVATLGVGETGLRRALARRDNLLSSSTYSGAKLQTKRALGHTALHKAVTPASNCKGDCAADGDVKEKGMLTLHTPSQPRVGLHHTWEGDLDMYMQSQGSTPLNIRLQRDSLASALRADPSAPERWWEFLSHEESVLLANRTTTLEVAYRQCRSTISLFHLFAWAHKTVPRKGNESSEAYLQTWLGYMRHQWFRSHDEAKDTFKLLKSQVFGECFLAYLYAEWAALEYTSGNKSKALAFLDKHIAAGAQPKSVLYTAKSELENGNMTFRANWGATHHTLNSMASTNTFYCAPGSTAELPAVPMTAQVPDVDRQDIHGGKYEGTKRGTGDATIMIRGTTMSHSMVTGSSGSDEATATLTMQCNRLATPATAGLTTLTGSNTTGSSQGSSVDGDAETLDLRARSGAEAGTREQAGVARGGASSQDGATIRPGLGKPGFLFKGVKRLGLGGGAARVAVGATPTASAGGSTRPYDEGDGDSSGDSGKKRKAEQEAAPSPLPHQALQNPGKRRNSPPAEVQQGGTGQAGNHARAAPAHLGGRAPSAARPPIPAGPSARPDRAGEDRPGRAPDRSAMSSAGPMPAAALEDPEATVPLINNRLAMRALGGRQSICPRDHQGALPPRHHESPTEATTIILPKTQQPSKEVERASEDLDSTLPLSRPTMAGRPNTPGVPVRSSTPGSAGGKPRAVPPPPPPTFASRPPVPPPPEVEAGVAGRAPMGPPPARPRQPLACISPLPQQPLPAAPQPMASAAAVPQQARVREDENTVVVRGTRYTKLECVGRGGSSKVFKVMAPNRKIYALKRIKLQGRDKEAAAGFIDEITLLQRLRGKLNIIQLLDAEVIRAEGLIYMIIEYGDIDLARLLAKHEKVQREGGATELDENFIRLYWQQMLQAVNTIHEARIVHSDLKPANFLMVEGQLKLIDFGIAKAIQSDTTSIARENQVGTLNYMSPEAILGGHNNIRGGPPMKVGRPSDLWSLGCILYQMVYGHTPFSHLPFIQKMHAITDKTHEISFPSVSNTALADVLRRCLDRNPRTRITMQELLEHPFLRPTASVTQPSPGQVGLTRDQLKKLLAEVSEATASGADMDALSEELFRQLSSGQAVDLKGAATQRRTLAPTPTSAPPLQPVVPKPSPAPRQDVAQESMKGSVKTGGNLPPLAATDDRQRAMEAKLREGMAKFSFQEAEQKTGDGSDDDDGGTSTAS